MSSFDLLREMYGDVSSDMMKYSAIQCGHRIKLILDVISEGPNA